MNEPQAITGATARLARRGGAIAWLGGRGRGRWATSRGRWIHRALTIALLLTGVSAWAVALVQPWKARTANAGMVAVTTGVDAEKVRSAEVDPEALLGEGAAPTAKPLRRNPFVADPGAAGAPSVPGRQDPAAAPCEKAAAEAPAEQGAVRILETVKGLRLEVILLTPAGERWAVINSRNYREGDAVAGLRIVEIQEGRVRLQQGDVTCLLRID
ncbi:MAG: hypothetical protein IMZ65_00715 [Planctomycetes bacterium]|nr:hypothetical protein [Planctomycetota bacterium]